MLQTCMGIAFGEHGLEKTPPRPPENPKVHFHSFQKASKNVLNMCILRIWPTRLPQTFEKTERNGTSQKTCETNATSKIIKKRNKYMCFELLAKSRISKKCKKNINFQFLTQAYGFVLCLYCSKNLEGPPRVHLEP